MLLIHGVYKFLPRRLAYKGCWCNHCEKITYSEKRTAWYVLHLYWVPLLPLGRYSFWRCEQCDQDPSERVRESVTLLVLGVIAFSIFFLALLFPFIPTRDPEFIWIARVVLLGLITYCVYLIWSRRNAKAEVIPIHAYASNDCRYCGEKLILFEQQRFCEHCQIYRLET